MHTIAILALPGVVVFDLATPCEVFGRMQAIAPAAAYEVRVCGKNRRVPSSHLELRAPWGLEGLEGAGTVVVPGVQDPLAPVDPAVLRALRLAHARGARIASICSGAFVLAAAGLLDGLRATTHWLGAEALAEKYPKVQVDPDVLFVDNGLVLTSAGAAAGLDLCLHLVRRDHGAALAAEAARLAVMPLEREGGQAQFIARPPPASPRTLQPLLQWMQGHLHQPLTLEAIAARAGMSTRTLSRRFAQQTGTTPLQWLLSARLRHAQALLETAPQLSVEQVAAHSGFGSAVALRERFSQVLGTSPARYRGAWASADRTHTPATTVL